MTKWNVKSCLKETEAKKRLEEIVECVLNNRGIQTAEEKEVFLNPPHPESVSLGSMGIDEDEVDKAVKVIKENIKLRKRIIVYGDYDADGITATAIMWEALNSLGANVLPYIPHRVTEGYGLNIDSLTELINLYPDLGLIVTVDQGIVASEAVRFVRERNIDVIVTDHHQPGNDLPDATAVIHTTQTSGSGVAWWLTRKFLNEFEENKLPDSGLELATIGTVADLLPLKGINRSLVKYGLEKLRTTRRPGLLALLATAAIQQSKIDTYHIGYMIAPRLNAMGRMEHALDSLRLLCTRDKDRAALLASTLDQTNRERQDLTEKTFLHAIGVAEVKLNENKLIIIDDESYPEGIIGLVAGKLVERFGRPAIVLSRSETYLKASARSIKAFNIIEAIRTGGEWYERAGGHPMAAGFTVTIEKYKLLVEHLQSYANEKLSEEDLQKQIEIDVEISFEDVTNSLVSEIKKLAPFGMGNPEPLFVTREVEVVTARTVGKKNQHLKLELRQRDRQFSAIAFNRGHLAQAILQQNVAAAFNVSENVWNGRTSLELKIKDIEIASIRD